MARLIRKFRTRKFPLPHEEVFQDFYAKRMYMQAKMALIFGLFTWYVFSIWDFTIFIQKSLPLGIVRLLIFGSCIGFSCWVCIKHKATFLKKMQFYLTFSITSAIVGICTLTLIAAENYGELAYSMMWPGMLLTYLFQYTFCRLLFKPAAILGIFSLFLVFLVAVKVGVSEVIFFNSLFYLVSCNILGLVVCLRMETYERMVFLMKRRLNIQLTESNRQRDFAQQSHAKLMAFNAEKDRFFSAAYHDLQQPLTTISLYIQIARKKLKQISVAELEPELVIMDNAKNEISLMFQEVSNIANIEHIETKIGVVNINEMFDEIVRIPINLNINSGRT